MLITTNYFLITVICEESVSEHLVKNLKQFEPTSYTIQKIDSGKGNAEEKSNVKVEVLCSRSLYSKVLEYVNQYYVKQYGVILYLVEVSALM